MAVQFFINLRYKRRCKMNYKLYFSLLCIICLCLFPLNHLRAEITEEEVLTDWNALNKTHLDLEKKLEETIPSYKPVIIGNDHEKNLKLLEDVKKNDIPKIENQLSEFKGKYGDTQEKINENISVKVKLDWRSGKHPDQQAGNIYEKLVKRLKDFDEAKKEKANEMLREAEGVQSRIDSFKTQVKKENYDELKSKLEIALKYNPENEKAKEWLARVDEDQKKAFAEIEKAIDEAKWPGHYSNFAGPGDPDKLAASAMEWLHKDEATRKEEDPDHTIAVCIKGDWMIAKKDLIGNPIQWGLPIYAACQNKKEKENDIARVFSLTILTREEKDIKKQPPWTGVWVGNIFKMRASNIKGTATTKDTTGGFWGGLFWLLLVVANILAGMLAASPLLKVKVPQLEQFYQKMTPFSNILGATALVIGLITFLINLVFYFSPLDSILPQLSAMLVGLYLGKELLVEKIANVKVQDSLQHIDKLEKYQTPIGLICIGLGILHLFIGSVYLF